MTQAHKAALATVIANPSLAVKLIAEVPPDAFGDLRDVYDAIISIVLKGETLDQVTISTKIKNPEALIDVLRFTGAPSNLPTYINLIKDDYTLRQASAAVKEFTSKKDIDSLDQLITKLTELRARKKQHSMTIYDAAKDAIEYTRKIKDSGNAISGRRYSGIWPLDTKLDGFQEGDIVVISGDSGSGKSTLFNNFLVTCFKEQLPLFYWSGEMNSKEIAFRMLAALSDTDITHIRRGDFWDNEKETIKIDNVLSMLKDKAITIDNSYMNLASIITTIKSYANMGVKIFLFDRLELISGDKYSEDIKGEIMNTLRSLANELGLTIIIAAQLRKSTQDKPNKRPTYHDVLGSGAIFQAATRIMLIYRPEMYGIETFPNGESSKGKVMIIVDKNTFGPTFNVVADFDYNHFLFKESEPPKAFNVPF